MKYIKKIFPFIFTVIIICISLYMPNLASMALDYRLRTQVNQMENIDVSFDSSEETDFLERAVLFRKLLGINSVIDIPSKSQACRLSENKVKSLAAEILKDITVYDISYMDLEAVPKLLISSDEDNSLRLGVFWMCLWNDKDEASGALWVDDESGKMVGFMLNYNDIYSENISGDTEYDDDYIPEIVFQIGDYCCRHYQTEKIEYIKQSEYNYIIQLTSKRYGEKNEYLFPLRIQNNELLFFNV